MGRLIVNERKDEFLDWLRKKGLEVSFEFGEYAVRTPPNSSFGDRCCVGVMWGMGVDRKDGELFYGTYNIAEIVARENETLKALLDEIESHVPYRESKSGAIR